MRFLIDGYNLLYASGIVAAGPGEGSFRRSRLELLDFVADVLGEPDAARTTVVFDASQAPPGLPKEGRHRGIRVLFARDHADADELVGKLIAKATAPRRLTVVSSDHRLHRAARRRRATPVDSDQWFAEAERRLHAASPQTIRKPSPPTSEEEVAFWLEKFAATGEQDPLDPFPPDFMENLAEKDMEDE